MTSKTIVFSVLGLLFLGIGTVGAFLPILPTTPFILLSVAFLSGVPTLRQKILKISIFREHLENYKHRSGITKKTLCINLAVLWGTLLLSMLAADKIWLLVLLPAVGVAVTIHLLWMAVPKTDAKKKKNEER